MKKAKEVKPKVIKSLSKVISKDIVLMPKDAVKIQSNSKQRSTLSFKKGFELEIDYAGIILPKERINVFDRKKDHKMQFGFFGGSSDSNKYFNDNTANSVIPKPEDYVDVPFRLLSATIVGAGSWKATDFSDVNILKSSMNELLGKPVYKNHDTEVDNWVGFVKNVSWQESYVDDNGTVVPAGINGLLALDTKVEPKMVRGVLSGAVYSNSVTVEFDWVPSHNFENPYEFQEKVGTISLKDNKMVRRVATEIFGYHETSMVWLGADPFAKLIDKSGNLRNIDKSSIQYDKADPKEKEDLTNKNKYVVNYGLDAESYLSLSRADKKEQNTVNMNKFLAAFLATFGAKLGLSKDATENDLRDEMVEGIKALQLMDEDSTKKLGWFTKFYDKALSFLKIKDAAAVNVDVEQFFKENEFISLTQLADYKKSETDLAALKAEETRLKQKITDLTPMFNIGTSFIATKKAEAVRLYKAAMLGKEDENVIALINSAKPEALDGLLSQYVKGATQSFSGKCKSCGSAEFEFKSSLSNVPAEEDKLATEVSFDGLATKYGRSGMGLTANKK